jgi:cobalt-precorrin 5A hydrolase
MRVAGLGFRAGASAAQLAEALALAGGTDGLSALSTIAPKADDPALRALGRQVGLPVIGIPKADIASMTTPTRSARIEAAFGTGSLAEASALAAAGPGARILVARVVTPDGMATAAIAEGDGT